VRLIATGTNANNTPFERGTSLVFQIASSRAVLNGLYRDLPQRSSPGSQNYHVLQVNVGIDVSINGNLGLAGDLVDAMGNFVAHSNTASEVSAGQHSLTLHFSAEDIYASERNGPYTLTHLLFTDLGGTLLPIRQADNVYTTAVYDYRQFGLEKLYIPLLLKNYTLGGRPIISTTLSNVLPGAK
jgi:hypothetical protein